MSHVCNILISAIYYQFTKKIIPTDAWCTLLLQISDLSIAGSDTVLAFLAAKMFLHR